MDRALFRFVVSMKKRLLLTNTIANDTIYGQGMDDSLNKRKLLAKAERSSNNLSFAEFVSLIEAFGFRLKRQRGSHHVFSCQEVAQIMDVQPEGGKAKRYQVEQLLDLVARYGLTLED